MKHVFIATDPANSVIQQKPVVQKSYPHCVATQVGLH